MSIRDTILIVDDMEVNRAILRNLFENEFNLLEAENGEQAMVLVEQYHKNIAVMLLDLIMPLKSGYQVLEEMGGRGLLAEFPVVVITAENSKESTVHAFDLGASDIIMKPFESYVIKRRVKNIIELNLHKQNQHELIEEQAAKLRESNSVMIDALSSIIEYRSVETGQHIRRIRMFTKVLLENVADSYPEFGLDDRKIDIIVSASSMHDIGKIAIPDSILNKKGPLSEGEFEVMKTHSEKGCQMLSRLDRMSDREYLQFAYNICRYHHERWNGRGYPDGLKGDSIPICAQVVGIADCYDALTTDRVYKKALPHKTAFNMILGGECGCFSPKILECFKNVQDIFQKLSLEYADGNMGREDTLGGALPKLWMKEERLDTLQIDQMKYFALLRYTGATVTEVDLTEGMYHVLYMSGNNLAVLNTGNSFLRAVENLCKTSVYPEDVELVLDMANQGIKRFFEEGKMRESFRFRIWDRISMGYAWCQADILRIDIENPRQKKILIIWRETEAGEVMTGREEDIKKRDAALRNLVGGLLQCKNDHWLTMTYVNSGFVNLFGYSEEEMWKEFRNRYMDLVYAADRENIMRAIHNDLKLGDCVELEYRVTTKDGRILWILDKKRLMMNESSEECFYSVLIDITRSRQAQEELRLTLDRHKIILEQSNDIIFEWDVEADSISYSSNWKQKFGYQPITEHVSEKLVKASHIHPEELAGIARVIEDIRNGIPYREMELRIADADGRYRWCKVRASVQFSSLNRPIKAIGVIADIDREKRESQSLKKKAEMDGLTGLYNKSTARELIEERLKAREDNASSALLTLDVDDFKGINDRYGHMFGDVVLQTIAEELRKLFRQGDILARIGGDEFLIYMDDVRDVDIASRRAERIIESFGRMFRQEKLQNPPACSIGIAVCPRDGKDFDVLFQHSDLALYEAKAAGKNRYLIFNRDMDRPFGVMSERGIANTRIDTIDNPNLVTADWIERAFAKLYETSDLDSSIESLLEMTGSYFGVDRAYIFEDDEDGMHTSNTYEWCSEGVASQKKELEYYAYEDLGGTEMYRGLFDKNGVFYCQDITKLPRKLYNMLDAQGIKALLQCAIWDNGKFRGYVGFDDCCVYRIWTKEQINVLRFTANLMTTFLMKARAESRAVNIARELRMILDNQKDWIYVIDKETYELRFINAKTYSLVEGAREGMFCYNAFFQIDEPCANCPLKGGVLKSGREIYNPVLHVWSSVDTSELSWGNRDAYLIICHDITEYKTSEQSLGSVTYEKMDGENQQMEI